ncbi:MAG: peptide chain release factor-like protein [Candidatus Omnitrophica bacterium]|nr:peptide chain release factor-like protein [Candidatus Omnitrophota bacterium]
MKRIRFPVGEEKSAALREKMAALSIREEDLQERFIRSQGAGGQNVNKVASCVCLKHRPTGIEVRCQQERSQALNRFFARQRLAEKVEAARFGAQSARQQELEKIRRQKRKRSKRAKEKMLASKKRQAEKKLLRTRCGDAE